MAARLRAPRLTGTITRSGPFFDRDPARTFAQNVRGLMDAIATEGARDLTARIGSIPPAGVRTGRTRRLVAGRTRAHSGRRWAATAVIGIPKPAAGADPIATYAALASIERRYRPVRSTVSALRSTRSANLDRLLDGIDR